MKILMLGWELPPHNSGGLGVACFQLCKALSNMGVSIDFVLPYTGEHEVDFMTVRAATPHSVEQICSQVGAYESFRYVVEGKPELTSDVHNQQTTYEHAVAKLATETEFDVIHAHDWLTFRAALRAKEESGKPLIVHVHSVESDRAGGERGNPLVSEIEATAMMLADRVIAVSNHTKAAIVRDYNIPAEKIEVVHNSIDATMLEPLETKTVYQYIELMKAQGYRVVVNVGRMTVQKGLPNLLQAAAAVIERVPKTLFMFVGSGEQECELIELAAQLGISRNIIFTGFLRGRAWREAFAIGDLFVMPSISEPFGLTPLEAIAYGTPALISKQSGVAEILNNVLKVDYWDIDEMANQITAVVRSDALRDALHVRAKHEYSRLSWQDSADKLLTLYNHHREVSLA